MAWKIHSSGRPSSQRVHGNTDTTLPPCGKPTTLPCFKMSSKMLENGKSQHTNTSEMLSGWVNPQLLHPGVRLTQQTHLPVSSQPEQTVLRGTF